MSAFWQKKGCLFSGKNQRFIKIRVLFWPEISALGVFFNFDNERMHPPKYTSDPPGICVYQNELNLCATYIQWSRSERLYGLQTVNDNFTGFLYYIN